MICPRTLTVRERGSAVGFDAGWGLIEISVRHDLESAGGAEAYVAQIKWDGRIVHDLGAKILGEGAGVGHANTPRTNSTDFPRRLVQVGALFCRLMPSRSEKTQ